MEFSPIGVLGQRGNQFFRLTEVGQCFLRGRAQQCLLGGGDEVAQLEQFGGGFYDFAIADASRIKGLDCARD